MIYECHECEKLYDEDYGYMANSGTIGFGVMGSSMVFICKNCMGEKGRSILEKINNEKKEKMKRGKQ